MESEYIKKIQQQIDQYANGFENHGLPNAYFYWSENFLRPGFNEVFGPITIDEFYALPFIEGSKVDGSSRFLSIGCGDGTNEISLAKCLLNNGLTEFEIVCADLSRPLLDRFEYSLDLSMRKHFSLVCADLNKLELEIEGEFNGIMASHSLHHIVELERLFDWIYKVLKPKCVFAINDMIGRNGHMRWPEAAIFVQMLWPLLGERQRYHAQLKKVFKVFEDLDCSTSGFEGIRSQDILHLLQERFSPRKYFSSGGIIDPFIDRGFGFGFDTNNDEDKKLLEFICNINDVLLDSGQIKPTIMLAHFYKEDGNEKYYRMRSVSSSIRKPLDNPYWTKFYPPVPLIGR